VQLSICMDKIQFAVPDVSLLCATLVTGGLCRGGRQDLDCQQVTAAESGVGEYTSQSVAWNAWCQAVLRRRDVLDHGLHQPGHSSRSPSLQQHG
jgi:hypothetical protein